MSFAGPVSHLPSPMGGDNFNPILLKTLFYMDFDQLNNWIQHASNGQYYLVKPKFTNIVDYEVCLGRSAHVVIYKAIHYHPMSKIRKNGRDKKLLNALKKNDFVQIAYILASSVCSYWRDHGCFSNQNTRLYRLYSCIQKEWIDQ